MTSPAVRTRLWRNVRKLLYFLTTLFRRRKGVKAAKSHRKSVKFGSGESVSVVGLWAGMAGRRGAADRL